MKNSILLFVVVITLLTSCNNQEDQPKQSYFSYLQNDGSRGEVSAIWYDDDYTYQLVYGTYGGTLTATPVHIAAGDSVKCISFEFAANTALHGRHITDEEEVKILGEFLQDINTATTVPYSNNYYMTVENDTTQSMSHRRGRHEVVNGRFTSNYLIKLVSKTT